jgi:hypothetical protein
VLGIDHAGDQEECRTQDVLRDDRVRHPRWRQTS